MSHLNRQGKTKRKSKQLNRGLIKKNWAGKISLVFMKTLAKLILKVHKKLQIIFLKRVVGLGEGIQTFNKHVLIFFTLLKKKGGRGGGGGAHSFYIRTD